MFDADNQLATYLGDGKEANGKTNQPRNQTNPALFAAPHFLTADSKGDLYAVERISFGRPRHFQTHPPSTFQLRD